MRFFKELLEDDLSTDETSGSETQCSCDRAETLMHIKTISQKNVSTIDSSSLYKNPNHPPLIAIETIPKTIHRSQHKSTLRRECQL